MDEEIREITPEPEKKPDINPLDYVTISVKEYKKLIKKTIKLKFEMKEQRHQTYEYYRQLEEMKEVVKQYKADYEKLLGIDELKKAQLAELSFEKGVKTDEAV